MTPFLNRVSEDTVTDDTVTDNTVTDDTVTDDTVTDIVTDMSVIFRGQGSESISVLFHLKMELRIDLTNFLLRYARERPISLSAMSATQFEFIFLIQAFKNNFLLTKD